MKTDKFEKTIRKKLESLTPDFHEDNWAQMQNYMQAHTSPSFWQQYSSWLGYAAAAAVTSVMTFLYAQQLTQNNNLVKDIALLKSKVATINESTIVKTDTIYVVQKDLNNEQFYENSSFQNRLKDDESELITKSNIEENPVVETNLTPDAKNLHSDNSVEKLANQTNKESENRESLSFENKYSEPIPSGGSVKKQSAQPIPQTGKSTDVASGTIEVAQHQNPVSNQATGFTKTLGVQFDDMKELNTVEIPDASRKMHYLLAERMSARQVRKVLLANNSIQNTTIKPLEEKKVEKVAKSERTIPKLNIKTPYRIGAGMGFEGSSKVTTIHGEVLLGKKFSVSTGLSWVKVKPMAFITEKVFRDKNHADFRKSHPNQVPPMGIEILNINVKPTLTQIPLTVAFRDDLGKDFSYHVGAGTNFTVQGKDQFSYDCRPQWPGKDFTNERFMKGMNIPLVNSLNLTAGIEKNWHPIVMQVEGYLYTYFKQLSPETAKTGPGVRVKLLYQIGEKNRNK